MPYRPRDRTVVGLSRPTLLHEVGVVLVAELMGHADLNITRRTHCPSRRTRPASWTPSPPTGEHSTASSGITRMSPSTAAPSRVGKSANRSCVSCTSGGLTCPVCEPSGPRRQRLSRTFGQPRVCCRCLSLRCGQRQDAHAACHSRRAPTQPGRRPRIPGENSPGAGPRRRSTHDRFRLDGR